MSQVLLRICIGAYISLCLSHQLSLCRLIISFAKPGCCTCSKLNRLRRHWAPWAMTAARWWTADSYVDYGTCKRSFASWTTMAFVDVSPSPATTATTANKSGCNWDATIPSSLQIRCNPESWLFQPSKQVASCQLNVALFVAQLKPMGDNRFNHHPRNNHLAPIEMPANNRIDLLL